MYYVEATDGIRSQRINCKTLARARFRFVQAIEGGAACEVTLAVEASDSVLEYWENSALPEWYDDYVDQVYAD